MKIPLLLSCTLLGLAAAPSLHATGLTASDGVAGDTFGYSVSLSGTLTLGGAHQDDIGANSNQGSAYLFRSATTGSGTVTQNLKLTASDGATNDSFGTAVSLSGTAALIGASVNNTGVGAAYLFRDVTTGSGTVTQDLKLTPSGFVNWGFFGTSVSLSGTIALVGADRNSTLGITVEPGAAYVFRDVDTGSGTVTQNLKLMASDGVDYDWFGGAVSQSGATALVGTVNKNLGRGSVYVFLDVTTGTGTRTEDFKLTASDATEADRFGKSVSQSGTTALVGAYGNDDADSSSGSAYVFRDVTTGNLDRTENLKLVASDAQMYDLFGASVSQSGATALVGAYGDDDKGSSAGSAYLFRDVSTGSGTRTEDLKLIASDGATYHQFGWSVSIDGDNFVIGTNGPSSFRGKAYAGSVSSMTTLDAGNASRIISGLSFISQGDWVIGQATDSNTVQLTSGDTTNVTVSGKAVYIGQNAGSDHNTLIVAGTLTANTVHIGLLSGNEGNTLQIGNGGTTGSVAGAIINHGNLTFNRSDTSTHNNLISGSGTLTKLGSGTITLTAASTYAGGTLVNAGTLKAGSAAAFGSGTVRVNAGTLNLGGFAVSNALDVRGGAVTGAANYAGTQTLSVALNYTGTVGGSLVVANGGALHTTGAVFTGATTVQSGGQISGTGSLGSLTLLAGGTLSPGNSPGILTVTGDTTWHGGANYNWQIQDATGTAGTGYDLVSISGALTLNATSENKFTLTLASLLANNTNGDALNFNSAVNSSYTIASATGGIFGFDPSAFTIISTGFTNATNGGSWHLSLGNSHQDLHLNFTAASAIPEPSTYAVILGALALALAAKRRRGARRAD